MYKPCLSFQKGAVSQGQHPSFRKGAHRHQGQQGMCPQRFYTVLVILSWLSEQKAWQLEYAKHDIIEICFNKSSENEVV